MRGTAGWRNDRRTAGAGWACGLTVLTCGCLVTNRTEFREDNVPAHLKPLSPAYFTRVPDRPDPACSSTGPVTNDTRDITSWMAFSVEVSDPNLEDTLEARLIINGQQEAAGATIVPTGLARRAPVTLCASPGEFTAPCNRVEFLVSTNFRTGGFYETETPGDLARWQWWVLSASMDDPTVTPSDCEMQQVDAGLQ